MKDVFLLFTIEHNLKSMSRYCEHDEDYVMTFEKKDGKKEEFHSSRADVEANFGKASKDESVAHFEQLAMTWYDAKYPKECKKVK